MGYTLIQGITREDIVTGRYDDELSHQGVYAWRRVMPEDFTALEQATTMSKFVWQEAIKPVFRADGLEVASRRSNPSVTVRKAYIQIEELSVGGTTPQPADEGSVGKLFRGTPDHRATIQDMLSSWMEVLGPVLYVGRSDNVTNRLRGHLQGNSGLLSHLEQVGLDINSVRAYALVVDESTVKPADLSLLEKLLTQLSVAPYTIRPG